MMLRAFGTERKPQAMFSSGEGMFLPRRAVLRGGFASLARAAGPNGGRMRSRRVSPIRRRPGQCPVYTPRRLASGDFGLMGACMTSSL